jgi:predicted TIM-barrel fold metal-dependent hydrolase
LRQLVEGQNPGTRFWYDERLRRQREWLDLVRKVQSERPPRERTIQRLRDYAAGFDLPVDPARLPQALALRRASADLAVAIHALTTPAQRAHAQQRIDDLIRDLTELSQEI